MEQIDNAVNFKLVVRFEVSALKQSIKPGLLLNYILLVEKRRSIIQNIPSFLLNSKLG